MKIQAGSLGSMSSSGNHKFKVDPNIDAELTFTEDLIDPELVDIDGDGMPIERKYNGHPAWQEPKQEFAKELFLACKVKYWGSKNQKKEWIRIITEMYSKYGQELELRKKWMKNVIDWAQRKNSNLYNPIISLDAVMTTINNETRYTEFKIKEIKNP